MLDASLAGAVPLQPQSSSFCFLVPMLARKQAGKKKERTEQNSFKNNSSRQKEFWVFPRFQRLFKKASISLIAAFDKKVVNRV